jgi:hypothetical protein
MRSLGGIGLGLQLDTLRGPEVVDIGRHQLLELG